MIRIQLLSLNAQFPKMTGYETILNSGIFDKTVLIIAQTVNTLSNQTDLMLQERYNAIIQNSI